MFSAAFYLIWGSLCLIVGITGRGMRPNVEADKAKKTRKLLTIVGAVLLVGGLWELSEAIL
jgi:hypothetical protein